MTERRFTFHGHEIIHEDEHAEPEKRVQAPCSVSLAIANAFDFMIENGIRTLTLDGVEIRRTR